MIFYVLFIAIALVSYMVQANLKSKFERYSRVPLASGLTGRVFKIEKKSDVKSVRFSGLPGYWYLMLKVGK